MNHTTWSSNLPWVEYAPLYTTGQLVRLSTANIKLRTEQRKLAFSLIRCIKIVKAINLVTVSLYLFRTLFIHPVSYLLDQTLLLQSSTNPVWSSTPISGHWWATRVYRAAAAGITVQRPAVLSRLGGARGTLMATYLLVLTLSLSGTGGGGL